ncbi:MAG: hypothetical protein ABJN04_05245 [Hyphomicrobiales bacterium]
MMPFLRWSIFHFVVCLIVATALSAVLLSLVTNFDYLLPIKIKTAVVSDVSFWQLIWNIIKAASLYFALGLFFAGFGFGSFALGLSIGLCAVYYSLRGFLDTWIVIGSAFLACSFVSIPAWQAIIERSLSGKGAFNFLLNLPVAAIPVIGPLAAYIVWIKRPRRFIGPLTFEEKETL